MRLLVTPSPVHIAVWEECYWRWCTLNEMTSRTSGEISTDGFESGPAPVGDRSLSAEVSFSVNQIGQYSHSFAGETGSMAESNFVSCDMWVCVHQGGTRPIASDFCHTLAMAS